MAIPKELLDELMKHYKKPEDLIGENGILKELTKSLVERALQGVNRPGMSGAFFT